MRTGLILASILTLVSPALACRAPGDGCPSPSGTIVQANVSFNVSRPVRELANPQDADPSPETAAAAVRQALYARVARECDVMLASIASSCQLTNINVSSREYSNPPHQPLMLDASVNATLTIEMKK